jgi:hypothetical protein
MSLINRIGTFRGVVTEHGIGKTRKSDYPQLILSLQGVEYWDEDESVWVDWSSEEENQITAYLVLFGGDDKAMFHTDACIKTFGWDAVSFTSLDNCIEDGETKLQFLVQENEYEGNVTLQVGRIDHWDAEPGRTLQKLDADELKDLDKRYALPLKKVAGVKPVKPKGAPAVPEKKPETATESAPPKKDKKKTAPPKKEKSCTLEQAWDACMKAKDKSIDDEKLGEVWLRAVETIAPDGDEENMTPELWQQVKEVVIEQVTGNLPF